MINIKELRIGNCIIDSTIEKKVLVQELTEEGIVYNIYKGLNRNLAGRQYVTEAIILKDIVKCDDAEPIPLTPEILTGCGFENLYVTSSNTHYYIEKTDFRVVVYLDGKIFEEETAKEIIHLHQLQNLYFSLTGSELDISSCR